MRALQRAALFAALSLAGCVLDPQYVGESVPTQAQDESSQDPSSPDSNSQGEDSSLGSSDTQTPKDLDKTCLKLTQERMDRCLQSCKVKKFDCRRCERDSRAFLDLCREDKQRALAMPELPDRRKKPKGDKS